MLAQTRACDAWSRGWLHADLPSGETGGTRLEIAADVGRAKRWLTQPAGHARHASSASALVREVMSSKDQASFSATNLVRPKSDVA